MRGLDPRIQLLSRRRWIAGSRPGDDALFQPARQLRNADAMKRSRMMFNTRPAPTVVIAAVAFLLGFCAAAPAQTVQQFYAGKTITLIVPFGPGAYYDMGARLMARHLSQHVAGHPAVVVQNQPSAGGIGLANRFATGADNDGLQIGVLQRAVPQYAFVGYQTAKFDPLKLSWIGSLSSYAKDAYVMVLNTNHSAKNVADLRKPDQKTRLGSGRSGSANLLYALATKDLLKLNIDMVKGYEGTAPILLAEQRGEVDGLLIDLSTLESTAAEQWRRKALVPIVQLGRKTRAPELPEAPTVRELLSEKSDVDFLDFAELPFFIALPVAAPAGVPPERLAALRQGFAALAGDQALLDEARKMNYEVSPIGGERVLDAIAEASKASAEVKARFKELISQ
jgi:tripartite-type tricarboxylate transporter receptor subunit TctC